MERLICQNCGEPLQPEGEFYVCRHCGSRYRENDAARFSAMLADALDDFKIESLAKARRAQYDATHAKFPTKASVVASATAVLAIRPEDFMANMYLRSYDGDPHALVRLLSNSSVTPPEAKNAFDWLLNGLQPRWIGAIREFVERHLRDRELDEAYERLEAEAAKIEEGIYDPSLPRDVFLCYSSGDMPRVIDTMELLEENDFSCWAAFRNLRAGRGAAERYKEEIQQAMKSCGCVVFLSSSSSRSPKCEAVTVELTFLNSDLPNKPRAEYLLEDYPSPNDPDHRVPIRAQRILDVAFDGLQRVRGEEELVDRVVYMLTERERREKERLEQIKKEAAEKAKKEILAEFEAKEAARKAEEAKREEKERQEREEKERQQRELEKQKREREEAERKEREEAAKKLQEERLALEKERLDLEKAKLSQQAAAAPSPTPVSSEGLDANAFLAMMEKAEQLKKEKAEAERKKREEEERQRIERQREAERQRRLEEQKRCEEQRRQEDIKRRSLRVDDIGKVYYGGYPWEPVEYDSDGNRMLIGCSKSVMDTAMNASSFEDSEVAKYLSGAFMEAFPDGGACFATRPTLLEKKDAERLSYFLPWANGRTWTKTKSNGKWIARKGDGTFTELGEGEKALVNPYATVDLESIPFEVAASLIEQYEAKAKKVEEKKKQEQEELRRQEEEKQRKQWSDLKETLRKEKLAYEIKEKSLTEPVVSWKDGAAWYGVYPQTEVANPPSLEGAEQVGKYLKVDGVLYFKKKKKVFKAEPIKWIIVGKNEKKGYVVLRSEKILDEKEYDDWSDAIDGDYKLSKFYNKFLNGDFLSLAFPNGRDYVFKEKAIPYGSTRLQVVRQVFLPAGSFFGLSTDWGNVYGKRNRAKSSYLSANPVLPTDFCNQKTFLVTNGDLERDKNGLDTVQGNEYILNAGVYGDTWGVVPCIMLELSKIPSEDEDPDISDPAAASAAEAELDRIRNIEKTKKEQAEKAARRKAEEQRKKEEAERRKAEEERLKAERQKREAEEKARREAEEKARKEAKKAAEAAEAAKRESDDLARIRKEVRETGVCRIREGKTTFNFKHLDILEGVKKIILPASVEEIDYYYPKKGGWDVRTQTQDGYQCPGLKHLECFEVDPKNPKYQSLDGCLIQKRGGEKVLMWCPPGKKGDIKLPKGVTEISCHAFCDIVGATSIDLGNGSLGFIQSHAIEGCGKHVFIPSSVDRVQYIAFTSDNEPLYLHFGHKKPLFGYPKGFDKDMVYGRINKKNVKMQWGVSHSQFESIAKKS